MTKKQHIQIRQVALCMARRDQLLKDLIKGPTPHERAAEIAPALTHTQHIQRREDANFRQATRLTNLLIRIRRGGKAQATKRALPGNVTEKKGS